MAADIQGMLENWARWLRGRAIQGHCASIEYRFRFRTSPDVDWREAPPAVPLPPIDILQAVEVERVMRWIPDGHRKALILFYVARFPYRVCCRRLHIGYDIWERFLGDAQRMVANRLTNNHVKRICSPTIRLPAFAEIPEPVGSECIG